MVTRYNRLSFLFGVPGIFLHIAGLVLCGADVGRPGALAALAGTGLLFVGLAFYAKAKGRHPAWGVFGLIGLPGLLVLACLKDLAKQPAAVQPAAGQDAAPPTPKPTE